MAPVTCTRPGCTNGHYLRGLCVTHYGARAKAGMTRCIPADTVAARIRDLAQLGWTYQDIHQLSGVSEDTVHRIVGTRTRQGGAHVRGVQQRTARRILALPLVQRDNARVPAVGTVRRIQGLALQGWPLAWQSTQCGLHVGTLSCICWRGPEGRVTYRTHRKVAELADRVCMDIGPDRRIATWARNKHWHPLMAWDDEDIDDPKARPRYGRNRKKVKP